MVRAADSKTASHGFESHMAHKMKKVIVTAGPIPARLDSVKVITNTFKGGLAAATATALAQLYNVAVVKWKHAELDLPTNIDVINANDVEEYYEIVLNQEADAYVLAAAVANLMPANPFAWTGKFPSHLYKENEEFDIRFKIAPRVIDAIKKKNPRSTLIGYKLFDGTEEELIVAGTKTLRDSLANVVFCNHPATAKSEKIALTPDGTNIRMSFQEHIHFIRRVIDLQWYRTEIVDSRLGPVPNNEKLFESWQGLFDFVATSAFTNGEMSFGTFAARDAWPTAFITTTRGKRGRGLCRVFSVDYEKKVVRASTKATMNAPLLARLFTRFQDASFILHAHKQIPELKTYPYTFPGTHEEDELRLEQAFNVKNHGYYAVFNDQESLLKWLEKYHGTAQY